MTRRLKRITIPVLILVFVTVLLYPFVFGGRALYWGDLLLYFYPMTDFMGSSIREGKLPLWNPYVYCGQPFVGNPQSWLFYPGAILISHMPVWAYFTLNAFIHLALAGIGVYLFLRRICHDRLGALLGACVYCGSGYAAARLQFPNMAQAIAYLPWLLLLVDRIIARPEVGYAALSSLVIALSILSAHAQITYMSLVGGVGYAIARLIQARHHRRRVLHAFGYMTVSMVLGVSAASLQLLPAIQLFSHSTREQLRWFEATRFTLSPGQLMNFIAPRYFGHPADGDYWGPGNLWESAVFVGVIPICLAGFALVKKPGRPAVAFFVLLGLVFALLAVGQWGGLFWIAYYVVPGISSFHDPARFAFLTVFSVAALSALGMRLLREYAVSISLRAGIALAAAINLIWFSSGVNPGVETEALSRIPRADIPASTRTYSFGQKDLWERFVNYADYGPVSPSYIALLTSSMAPNTRMAASGSEAAGYEPVPIRNITEIDRAVRELLWSRKERSSPILDLMNVAALAHPADLMFPGPPHIMGPAWRGWQSRRARSPVWFAENAQEAARPGEALGAITAIGFDPKTVYVEGLELKIPLNPPAPNLWPSSSSSDGDEAVFSPTSTPRLLFRSAAFYPGWEALVNGTSVPVLRANHAFQAVVIPPGADSVRFVYRPQVFLVGLYVTLLSLLAIAAMLTCGALSRRTSERSKKEILHKG